jgi:hypothetical protein
MSPPPLFHTKVGNSLIMTDCNRTVYWIFYDAMPKIVMAALTLTLITSKQPLYTQSLYSTNQLHSVDIHY